MIINDGDILIRSIEKFSTAIVEMVTKKKDHSVHQHVQIDGSQSVSGEIMDLFNSGQFSKMEDLIFSQLERDSNNQKVRELSIELYLKLLLKDDLELEQGNLPRSEVEESLLDLRS